MCHMFLRIITFFSRKHKTKLESIECRMFYAWLSILLSIPFILIAFGCKHNNPKDNSDNIYYQLPEDSVIVNEDGHKYLTGIFIAELIPLSDDMEIFEPVLPDYNYETGVIRFVATKRVNEIVDDEDEERDFLVDHYSIITINPDGSYMETPIPLHWSGFIVCGDFDRYGFRYIEADQSTHQMRLLLKIMHSDETIESLSFDIESFFNHKLPTRMFSFPNGDTLYVIQNEVFLVSDNNVLKAYDLASGEIQDAGMTDDGRVFVTLNTKNGAVIKELIIDNGKFGPDIEAGNTVSVIRFGYGFDFYYSDEKGIYGAVFEGDSWTSYLVLNFINSGLNRATESFFAPISSETMLFIDKKKLPILYHKSFDLDVDDLIVLTVGYDSTWHVPAIFTSIVSEFKKTNPDVRIITKDYAQYNTKERPNGGEQQLALDLVTGIFKPDILIGPSEAEYMKQVRNKGLFHDLSSVVSEDNELFGCIMRLYNDGQGRMWGITPAFSIQTVFADPTRLGKFAEQGYLSTMDFIDLAESTREGQFLIPDFSRGISSFNWLLGWYGNGYRLFIDRETGTASFDSPEFLKVIKYLASLPTEEEIHHDTSFIDKSQLERIFATRNGTILFTESMGNWVWVQPELWTGTENWLMIGYPTGTLRSGAGTTVTPTMTLVVTDSCKEIELAERFVSMLLQTEEAMYCGQFPSSKSLFQKKATNISNKVYALFYSGMIGVWEKNGIHPSSDAELSEPGFLTEFTSEKATRLEIMLDDAGVPLLLSDDEEILDIVREEVLSFLSGIGSAEDCAKKIQSRVTIWLSEHN